MYFIEGDNIGTVWLQAIKLILQQGKSIADDKGLIQEVLSLQLHIHHPSEQDAIIQELGDTDILTFMQRNFEDHNPIPSWGYSYAQRLYNTNGQNLITQILAQLKRYPTTKSATISLLNPAEDIKHTPCLTTLDFKLRQDTLYLHAFFRSQDIGNKLYADAVQLLRLGNTVAKELHVNTVSLFLSVCSAHIYEKDIPKMQLLLK